MSEVLQHVYGAACVITYVGVGILLFVRFGHKQRAYLRRLPSMRGVSLDPVETPPIRDQLAMIRAPFERQSDPEIEVLRHDVLRSILYAVLWDCLAPFLYLVVFILLTQSGLLR